MNGILKPSSERLYLHKDEHDEIFVESVLHQHHIDGIRFLYKQFKKSKLGVIINNPLGYGNSLQVALFLGAIRDDLAKPILILCEQSEELNWLEHFQKLTQCYNVGVGAENPFVKKSIFINTMERLEQFCRRDWSVMVVDSDDFLKEKTLQTKFKADFKIWITPVDMKDNLQTFSSIHKWIFPKDKLNISDFKAKPGDRIDALEKSILLEAFLEDIVCRTTLQTPFENPYEKSEDTPRKASKKNKDATGTKIKRSKRSLDAANMAADSDASAGKLPRTDTDDFSISRFTKGENKCDTDNKPDLDSFASDEPFTFDPFSAFKDIPNTRGDATEYMDDEPMFDTAERLNRLLESNVPMDIAVNPESCFIDSDTNSDSLLPIPKSFDDTSHDKSKGQTERATPDFLTDNILNENKEEMSESRNSDMFNDDDKGDVGKSYKSDINAEDNCSDK